MGQNEIHWTKNRSTSWESLQAGDTFLLGGLLANVLIHSEKWRELFAASRPNGCATQAPTITTMQLWFSAQPVPRKWAEKLVIFKNVFFENIILKQILPLFSRTRDNIRGMLKMRRLRESNPEKYLKPKVNQITLK